MRLLLRGHAVRDLRWLLIIIALILTACGTGASGELDQRALITALEEQGMTVERGGDVEQVFFSVKGQFVSINGKNIQVFEFPSAEIASTEASLISPDGSSVGTTMISWIADPHFFQSGWLIVIYVGNDQTILDALTAIMGEQIAGR